MKCQSRLAVFLAVLVNSVLVCIAYLKTLCPPGVDTVAWLVAHNKKLHDSCRSPEADLAKRYIACTDPWGKHSGSNIVLHVRHDQSENNINGMFALVNCDPALSDNGRHHIEEVGRNIAAPLAALVQDARKKPGSKPVKVLRSYIGNLLRQYQTTIGLLGALLSEVQTVGKEGVVDEIIPVNMTVTNLLQEIAPGLGNIPWSDKMNERQTCLGEHPSSVEICRRLKFIEQGFSTGNTHSGFFNTISDHNVKEDIHDFLGRLVTSTLSKQHSFQWIFTSSAWSQKYFQSLKMYQNSSSDMKDLLAKLQEEKMPNGAVIWEQHCSDIATGERLLCGIGILEAGQSKTTREMFVWFVLNAVIIMVLNVLGILGNRKCRGLPIRPVHERFDNTNKLGIPLKT